MSLDAPEWEIGEVEELSFGIVAARFNQVYIERLLAGVLKTLADAGVESSRVRTVRVPGSHEVAYGAGVLASTGQYDCIVALGVLIGGDTIHHEIIAKCASGALIQIGLKTGIPVINGIIVADSAEQAAARCGTEINRGEEFALGAIEMAILARKMDEEVNGLMQDEEAGEGREEGSGGKAP